MKNIEHFVVVIPARDEEALIARSLDAVETARRRLAADFPAIEVTTVVVADGCVDATAEIARGFAGVVVRTVDAVGVGRARAEGVATGLVLTTAPLDRVWIANTDADSAVPERWLADQLESARRGVDVYVGDVRPDFDDLTELQRSAWLATHVPGVARGHIHGANLGIRASAYELVGGFTPRLTGEDVDLVDRARAAGLSIATSGEAVLTSGRSRGRAAGGYAHYLTVELVRQVD